MLLGVRNNFPGCECNWTCTDCTPTTVKETISFNVKSERVFTTAIDYSLIVSHYKGIASVDGRVVPEPGTVFYGADEPTVLYFTLFPARYIRLKRNIHFGFGTKIPTEELKGYSAQLLSIQPGTQANFENFGNRVGLAIRYVIEMSPTIYQAKEQVKNNIWVLIANICALLSATIAVCQFLMANAEEVNVAVVKKIKYAMFYKKHEQEIEMFDVNEAKGNLPPVPPQPPLHMNSPKIDDPREIQVAFTKEFGGADEKIRYGFASVLDSDDDFKGDRLRKLKQQKRKKRALKVITSND